MTPLGWTALGILFVVCVLMLCAECSRRGYMRGQQDGYKRARADAENWWQRAELEIDGARRQIWREEPKSGRTQ